MLESLLKNLDIAEISSQLASLGIPNDKTGEAIDLAKGSVVDTFKSQASDGDMSDLLGLFNGKQSIGSSSLVQNVIGNYASQLGQKLGISADIAKSAANMLIPMLFSKLDSNSPSSGLTDEMLKEVVGGDLMSGLGGKLKGLFS